MNKKNIWAAGLVIASSFSAWAEPGGTYTLTGQEKGIEEIIQADMAQYPELYKGVNARGYLSSFKRENNVGKRKFSPGDVLRFPHTPASLKANRARATAKKKEAEKPEGLPRSFKLRGLPTVVQEGSYCVPASGEVIATFHDIETDQWELAKLSSQDSMDNSGTNPFDMARALENFGFQFHAIQYKHATGNVADFVRKTLPQFKKALVQEGPMYISIREIFGSNHGCVVIGYNDTREKMYFYNPWGEEFNLSYKEVAKYSYRAIAFTPPQLLEEESVDCAAIIETLKRVAPNNEKTVEALQRTLRSSGLSFKLVECNRNDIMDDASKTERLARREGQKFIELALQRAPAILIPQTNDEGATHYLFIQKSQDSKEEFTAQRITSSGWGAPESASTRLLIREWTTPTTVKGNQQWRLPLFEFSAAK